MFCGKCGKDIKDNKFCPYCGTKVEAEGNEEIVTAIAVDEEKPKELQEGKYGEIITADGRHVFNSAQIVNKAAEKSSPLSKVASIVLGIMLGCFCIGILSIFFAFMGDTFAWAIFIPVVMAVIISLLLVGLNVVAIVLRFVRGKWLKENNVDVKETLERDFSADKNSKKQLMVDKLVSEKPVAVIFDIFINIFNVSGLAHFLIGFACALVALKFIDFTPFGEAKVLLPVAAFAVFVPFVVYQIFVSILRAIEVAVAKSHLAKSNVEVEENKA